MRTFRLLIFATLGLSAASLPLAASAFPIVAVPQPPGVGCVAVKIVSTSPNSWGTMNCTNGLAYLIKNKVIVTPLTLPAGATSERTYDVDGRGDTVGLAVIGGADVPFAWNPAGAPGVLPNPGNAGALGIDQFVNFTVGFAQRGAVIQAFWFRVGPHWIGAAPNPSSFAFDVNKRKVNVGQFQGVAAAGVTPALTPLPGFAAGSVAFQINEHNVIVGHQDIAGGACAGGPPGNGFIFPFPAGPLSIFAPLPGDCTASAEDLNDNVAVVGYSLGVGGPPQAAGLNLPAPFPPGLVNLNTFVAHPWVRLTDAPGVDILGDVIATDGFAAPTQVYILN